jgi:hypothetical protein
MDLEGAPEAGDVGPARAKQVGRRRDKLVDNLVIEDTEPNNTTQKMVPVVYCIACDQRTMYRNPQRIKAHALECQVNWPPDGNDIILTRFSCQVDFTSQN